ncbi:MAG: hypothetical protein JXR31_08770 [Prolixibacteraceae bacterium]|nr:hypothetical protein [Prolixibacteraceae bacterium]MBN2774324.1 hypothetical protein [Prolixibacteraceae bacterium]
MKKEVFFFGMLLFYFVSVQAQYDCKVMIENLQGQYNGECKKGIANGEGSAKGIDTYVGNFKKGFPHRFGVYTYQNGSNYIGNFNMGQKDGYGLYNQLTENGTLVQDYGLWLADKLVIPNDPKGLYRVKERKGVKLIDPRLIRDNTVENQIWINFQTNGVPDKSAVITKAEITNGHKLATEDRSLNTLLAFGEIESFPVTFRLEYQIRQTSHFEMLDCMVEVTLFTGGRWEIDINH